VLASSSQAVDGDTNDPGRPARPNDTLDTAQAIPNPITLGGYVNQPGTGAEGRSRDGGDIDDYYRVQLLAGQTVTMLVADFLQADADLYLYDLDGQVVDFSIESGEVETLVITEDGTYLVNAFAFAGATNYILAIGGAADAAYTTVRRAQIVPWEAVITYHGENGALSQPDKPTATARRMGMQQRAGGPGRGRLMTMRRAGLSERELSGRLGSARLKKRHIQDAELQSRWETLVAIKGLRSDPSVRSAEPNYRVHTSFTPDDEAFPFQWHYPLIDLPSAWDTTTGEPSVIVAVVDTGILSRHPDLAGQWVPGYDFVRSGTGDGDGIDPDPEDPGNRSDPGASSFHGTHVAGTVAAAGNNGLGVTGVAPGARIMPLRALGGGGSGTSYDVNQAIRYAAGLPNDSGTVPERPADIINLSLGGAGFSQQDQGLLDRVRERGITVVAAAGNEGSGLPSYPAAYAGVISVSAVDSQQLITRYSNFGSSVDIAAPGGDNSVDRNGDGYPDGVLSTGGTGAGASTSFAYTFLSGTSMAAPHVAGVLALMKSVNPALSVEDLEALLVRGDLSDDLGTPGRDDQYGEGLINSQRALLAAIEATGQTPATDPRLFASASTLNFGLTTDSLVLELSNGGDAGLRLLAVEAMPDWLGIEPENVDAAGLGRYRATVERGGLESGVYSGSIVARSNANDITVRVLLSVGNADAAADVGLVYILLHDLDEDETEAQFVARAENGEYPYRFDQVPPGRYEIIAGSDADNDLFICDPGEACGAWLSTDQPIMVELQQDLSELDFPIEYLISIPNGARVSQGENSELARPRRTKSIAKGD
jgi:serine protease